MADNKVGTKQVYNEHGEQKENKNVERQDRNVDYKQKRKGMEICKYFGD